MHQRAETASSSTYLLNPPHLTHQPRQLFCVWTARNLAEFKILDAPLLEAAS